MTGTSIFGLFFEVLVRFAKKIDIGSFLRKMKKSIFSKKRLFSRFLQSKILLLPALNSFAQG
jgi:hypothetical protein